MVKTWTKPLTLSPTAAQSSELPASHTQARKSNSAFVALE